MGGVSYSLLKLQLQPIQNNLLGVPDHALGRNVKLSTESSTELILNFYRVKVAVMIHQATVKDLSDRATCSSMENLDPGWALANLCSSPTNQTRQLETWAKYGSLALLNGARFHWNLQPNNTSSVWFSAKLNIRSPLQNPNAYSKDCSGRKCVFFRRCRGASINKHTLRASIFI